MPADKFEIMLEMQRQLQLVMPPPNQVPADLQGDERATFMVWNVFGALTDELHEAMDEMGWKPWATSRHLNGERMLSEFIDAWHFFMNALLVVAGELEWDTHQLAEEFFKRYAAKNEVNRARQLEGYDGVSTKCPICKRELSEVDQATRVQVEHNGRIIQFCTQRHADAVDWSLIR